MPEANSAPILSDPVNQYPRITPPESGQKPKLLDRLCEALRSRHYSRRTKFHNGFFHLTLVDLFRAKNSLSPRSTLMFSTVARPGFAALWMGFKV